jgi:hypothetical protein
MTVGAVTGEAMTGEGIEIAGVAPQDGARYATVADGVTAQGNDRGNPRCRRGAAAQRKEKQT